MEEDEEMNGDDDHGKWHLGKDDDEKKDKEDEVRSGLRAVPKSDLDSLRARHGHKISPGLGSEGEDGKFADKEKKNIPMDPFDIEKLKSDVRDGRFISDIMKELMEFYGAIKNKFNKLAKRNESLIFDTLKTALHGIADIERTELGGIRVTRPPKDKSSKVTKDEDSGKITRIGVNVNHEFHRCVTCGDEIGQEFYILYDLTSGGTTIRVFDTSNCRTFWVKQNRSAGLGWSDDVTTIRNLAYGYYTAVEISNKSKDDIGEFIDWIAHGKDEKNSQQRLIIGPETTRRGSKEIRWLDEGVKTLSDYAHDFVHDPGKAKYFSGKYVGVIQEFIKFVDDALKEEYAAEERSE